MKKVDKKVKEMNKHVEEMERLASYDGDDRIITLQDKRKQIENQGDMTWSVSTPFPQMNRIIKGIRGGEYLVVGGPTKGGKTVFCQTLTQYYARKNIQTLWFPFEGALTDFLEKLPGVTTQSTMPSKLIHNNWQWFEDRVKESVLKYQVQVVFVDHLHFLIDLALATNVSWNVGNVTRSIVRLAKDLNVIFFVVAHITKFEPVDQRGNPKVPFHTLIRDCIPGNSLIFSNGKRIRAKDIKAGDRVASFRNTRELQPDVVKNVWKAGNKNMLKIKTKTGREIDCSDGHKFFATTFNKTGKFGPNQGNGLRGWTEAKLLKVGQKIAVPQKYPTPSLKASIIKEMAFLLGLIIGDGHITKKGHTEITVNTQNEVDFIKKAAKKAWNLTIKSMSYRDKNAHRVYLTNSGGENNYLKFIRSIGYCSTKTQKYVPEIIFRQPNDIVAKFLAGLFQADGSATYSGSNKSLMIRLSTISKQLAKDVQHLLLRFGIISSLRTSKANPSYGFGTKNNKFYVVAIRSFDSNLFNKEIGFILEKQKNLEEKLETWCPKKFKKHRGRDIFFDKITSIESNGQKVCYDIEVIGHHCSKRNNSFCVDDFITHNSSFVTQDSDYTIMVWRKIDTSNLPELSFKGNQGYVDVQLNRVTGETGGFHTVLKPDKLLGEGANEFD